MGNAFAGNSGLAIQTGNNGVTLGQSGDIFVSSNGAIYNSSNIGDYPIRGGFGPQGVSFTLSQAMSAQAPEVKVEVGNITTRTTSANISQQQSSGSSGSSGSLGSLGSSGSFVTGNNN